MRSPAPVPLRRPGLRDLRHPHPGLTPPVPWPAPPDAPRSLEAQAATGALFSPASPAASAAQDESTGITLPPARSRGRVHGNGGRLAAPERELLAALLLALVLSAAAVAYGRLSTTALLLAGVVLLSGLGLLALGCSARRTGDRT